MPTENRSAATNKPPVIGETPLGGSYYAVECIRCGWIGSSEELTDDCQCTQPDGEHTCLGDTDEIGAERLLGIVQAMAKQEQHQGEPDSYPSCDYCGITPDYHPWHGSGLLNGVENRHIHACDGCRGKLPVHPGRPQGEPIAWMVSSAIWWSKPEAEADADLVGKQVIPIGPLADAGEVERLRTELEHMREERDDLSRKLDRFYSRSHGIRNLAAIESLSDKLAERDALLRDKSGDLIRMAAHLIGAPLFALQDLQDEDKKMTRARVDHAVDVADARLKDAAYELRRIANALSASAEPVIPRSEPAAYHWEQLGGNGYCYNEKLPAVKLGVSQESYTRPATDVADQKSPLLELTDDLREVLGRPNVTCSPVAKALRVMGLNIAPKAEDEQAVVIHWLLGHYLKHGAEWHMRATAELQAASLKLKS